MSSPHVVLHNPNQNHLLAAMQDADFARLAPHLEQVAMRLGDVIYDSGDKLHHVVFPHHRHRFAALSAGKRRLVRNCRRRQ